METIAKSLKRKSEEKLPVERSGDEWQDIPNCKTWQGLTLGNGTLT
jgi:hypothetical protein